MSQRRGRAVATAYGPPWNAMEGSGVTSTGVKLPSHPTAHGPYVIAVDPRVIPYGSKVKIPNNPFGNPNIIFTAADTGGAIKGGRIDFFVPQGRAKQNAWGRRSVIYEIVGHGSPHDVAHSATQGSAVVPGTPGKPGKKTRIPGKATVDPGGTSTNVQGAILDSLSQHPKNLAGSVLGRIASGAYDTVTPPTVKRGPKTTVTGPSTPGTPARAGGSGVNYVHPVSKRLADERIDQGKDFGGAGPLYALGDGVIKSVGNLPGWPGTGGLVLHLTSGPWAGKNIFYAEGVRARVKVGQRVSAGDHIADATGGSSGIEIGFANAEGTNAQAHTHYSEGQQTHEGKHFSRAIGRMPRRK